MRRGHALAWLVTVPIALIGVASAHALANLAFGSPEEAGELFAAPDSGSGLVPVLAALALGLVAVGLAGRIAAAEVPRRTRAVALPFAALPPVGFLALELLEGLLHRGVVPWSSLLGATFLVGLFLQLPFAVAGYLAARGLLRAAEELRRLVRQPPPSLPASAPRALAPAGEPDPRVAERGCSRLGRAPPAVRLAST
jgi:hypothetical protein